MSHIPTRQSVIDAFRDEAPLTVMEVARRVYPLDPWLARTNTRNRLYELVDQGDLVADKRQRPMTFRKSF